MGDPDPKTTCPACGGTDLSEKLETFSYKPVYADKVSYRVPVHQCNDCIESFTLGSSDEFVAKVFRDTNKDECKNILQYFYNFHGFSSSYLERVLGLPGGTLAEWTKDGPSPEGLTLLRFVRHDVNLLKLFPTC
jgi:YgiT-type zinc finger domain-containing protein